MSDPEKTGNFEHEHGAYALRRPFKTVQSAGGPFDDVSYVAGYQAALIEKALHDGQKTLSAFKFMVYSALVPDCDLIAMEYGFTMTREPWEENPDEWTQVMFTNEKAAVDDGTDVHD